MIKIRTFIKRVGIKDQGELAGRLGVKRGTVAAWSSGARTPTYEVCVKLLEMGMTVEELFGKPYPSTSTDKPHGDMDELVAESLKRLVSNLGKI